MGIVFWFLDPSTFEGDSIYMGLVHVLCNLSTLLSKTFMGCVLSDHFSFFQFFEYKRILAWDWSAWIPDLSKIWFAELAVIDNTPVTVGLICKGILLLIIGYYICRLFSREVENRLLSRLDIDISLRHTLGTIIFYFLLSILMFFILSLLKIPISVFAWIGGAFALGIGLGSQNIVNNFISGIVMMAERPVKVGDIIEVEGFLGMVEHIGARSTQIKSLDNTHIIVPNSSFLEKNILNWTLSDDLIRTVVSVGVGYGSPTKKVEEILKDCVKKYVLILEDPEPLVLFTNFGSSSLDFDLIFWTELQSIGALRKLESDVRHAIDTAFKEHGITIPFPQLDVHFNNNAAANGQSWHPPFQAGPK